ncbi:MAG TPA: TlpA disulfide reductase family protein [Acetobacteraceae bacterium]|jgi:thiol-disulfide isomerase/thioredoxin|nr:TlpA disulfide reductase family protein [Acetobacteraceae bacterium]
MLLIRRRRIFAAAGTLAAALTARKPQAAVLHDLGADLVPTNPPAPPPDISFTTPDGAEHHLTDFAGHGMVVNLWATWCVPCVEEMPSLAALSKTLAPDDIAVLPLSSDRGGARVVEAFYQEHGITGLPVLLDSKGTAARAWRARGLPTSLIIDKQGRERARLEGSADWSTPAAAAIVRKLVAA